MTMKKVFKYPLPFESLGKGDIAEAQLPHGAQVLSFHEQHGIPCLWALVDPDMNVFVTRFFRIAGTGHPIEPVRDRVPSFIGTAMFNNGALVFHCFELVLEG